MSKKLFLSKFLQSPEQVGSIIPSSRYLARSMMKGIDWSNTSAIVELGAGTGIFTQEIRKYKKPECQVLIFEQDQEMRLRLQKQYPFFSFFAEARQITKALEELGLDEVDCIISGLPFANFSKELRQQIMDQVYCSLKPGGLFIAFQYSLQMKRMLDEYFAKVDLSFVPLNIPPAFVYSCSKTS